MAESRPHFKRLLVREIFGPGSHDVDIAFNQSQHVTVLHGKNGVGKTITLGLIDALCAGRYGDVLRWPFRQLMLELSDGSSLELAPTKAARDPKRAYPEAAFVLRRTGAAEQQGKLAPTANRTGPRKSTSVAKLRSSFGLELVDDGMWFDRRSGILLSTLDAVQLYPESSRLIDLASSEVAPSPEVEAWRAGLPKVKFVRTDRLHIRTGEEEPSVWRQGSGAPQGRGPRLMVDHLSQQVRRLVSAADKEYRQTSISLDSSLGRRLMDHKGAALDRSELWAKNAAVAAQEQKLRDLGLLRDAEPMLDERELTEPDARTLAVILEDRERKLQPFLNVVAKADRLIASLDNKLHPKKIRLDVEKGYRVTSATGTDLPLEQLSSGEQHELVLLHELLFEVEPGTLILIDEPELSLHVTWQEAMLPDLLEIARLADLDFVLATHSPYIVGDHTDLMVQIGESL